MVRLWPAGLVGMLLTGCTAHTVVTPPPPHATVESAPQPAWMLAATPVGAQALDTLDKRFAHAIRTLPAAAATRARSEGALLDPGAAQLAPQLPPGPYHCRLIRLGGTKGMQAFPPDICYALADQDGQSFVKSTGENRPDGRLYADGDRRLVLLGTARRAGETGAKRYGDDPARDLVGLVERVSSFRWRLILDRTSARTGTIDIYELVPVPPEVKGAKPMVPNN